MKVIELNLWYGKYKTRWYIQLWTSYLEVRIYLHRNDENTDMMKCLKKAWKCYWKRASKWNIKYPLDPVNVDAIYEREDGDLSYIGQWWAMEDLYYREENDIPLPEEISFI